MTDYYARGFKITLATLRGGAQVIVVREASNNRYLFHFDNAADFEKWSQLFTKEYDDGSLEREKED